MKKKVAFWIVMILINVSLGAISIRTYQNIEARVAGVENYQKNYDGAIKNYNDKFDELSLLHRKTVSELLRVLGVDGKYDFNNNLARIWDLNMFFEYKADVVTIVVLEVSEELRNLAPDIVKGKSITKNLKVVRC